MLAVSLVLVPLSGGGAMFAADDAGEGEVKTAAAPPASARSGAAQNDAVQNSVGMRFVSIAPGEFSMGLPDAVRNEEPPEEYPPHRVAITRPYYLGVCEVTQRQWQTVMNTNPSWHSSTGGGAGTVGATDTSDLPIEQISYNDVIAFCTALGSRAEEAAAKRSYLLPTEAEWEYACLGGKTAPFVAGGGAPAAQQALHAVGGGSANEFGLYDMRGNAWEWCADWYGVGYYRESAPRDPQGPAHGVLRVVRGRDWIFSGFGDRPYLTRDPSPASRKCAFLGCRLVCIVAQSKP